MLLFYNKIRVLLIKFENFIKLKMELKAEDISNQIESFVLKYLQENNII